MQEYACRVTNDGRQTHCKSTRTVNHTHAKSPCNPENKTL